MSFATIEARAAAIHCHLFLLCPNNSGSTYLSGAIGRSSHVWSLEREGQHVVGFGGPSTMATPWPLIWGGTPESLAHFAEADYDWERTRKAWYFHAKAAREDAPVFHTKSPPFLLVADQLRSKFEGARFLLMVRDPYATIEGIIRRRSRSQSVENPADLVRVAARHLVTCFEYQRRNITLLGESAVFFTYEDLCAEPCKIAGRITDLVPDLDDLDLVQTIPVKGSYEEPLRNMNDQQIARLDPQDRAIANEVFEPNRSVLEAFGYTLLD
ncbi:MAG: sulfotransferase [Pseudomonadota bacterium]